MSDDLISRKAAIDVVHKTIFKFFDIVEDDSESPITYQDKRLLELNKSITQRIRSLPSADGYADGFADGYKRAMMDFPSAGQWTPVTERPPEEDTDVIVTDSVGDVETAYMSVFWDEEGESRVWYTGDCYRIEVKAWMPLPEPYKGAN